LAQWDATLSTYGLKVSTGPVVAFRSKKHIRKAASTNSVPLLWMQHVKSMCVTWPLEGMRKPQYIVNNRGSRYLLVPNRNYVLLRRFSAKEEARRLVAAPYERTLIDADLIGLENHLNYIYRVDGELTSDEAWGLAVLLNSRLLDLYFRTINGNTQVSATELRRLPLPDLKVIKRLGRIAHRSSNSSCDADRILYAAIKLPETVSASLKSHEPSR